MYTFYVISTCGGGVDVIYTFGASVMVTVT